jgi:hypothetical protein
MQHAGKEPRHVASIDHRLMGAPAEGGNAYSQQRQIAALSPFAHCRTISRSA